MEQILYIFTYFPYLAISLILFGIIIGLLLAAFLQIGQPTIIHNIFHQPAQESADYKGCFIRIASLLAICIITISLLLSYAPTFALSPLPTDQAKHSFRPTTTISTKRTIKQRTISSSTAAKAITSSRRISRLQNTVLLHLIASNN